MQSSTESRLEFETLISDTSASLFSAPVGELELAVERALGRVRAFFHADRCVLLTVSPDQQAVNARLGSYSEGVPPVPADLNLAPLFPWSWQKLLVECAPVRVTRMSDLPPEAELERESWIQMPIRSALTLPIESGGVVSHIIVLNTVSEECQWPDAYVTRLRVLGEMLAGAVERQAMFTELRDAEERANLAADSADAGLWALDYRTGVCWASERARSMFGYSRDEVITTERLESTIHPEDRESVRATIEQAVRDGRPFDVEYRILPGGGGVCWVATRGRPHYSATGELDRAMGVSIDITPRKQAEEALRKSEARLSSGADLAGLGFYEVDFQTGSMYVDDRMRSVCGISADLNEGLQSLQFWMDHIHADDQPRVMSLREKMHTEGMDRISLEYRFLHQEQGIRWIHHLASVARRDATGRAVRTFGVLRDITERRQAEEALRESYAEIERLKDRLQAEGEYLKAEMQVVQSHGVVTGQSAGIRKVLHMVEQVAPTDSSVLVHGETGTGKELVAQAIHRLSPRRSHLMVKVNCAALPSGLVESELFGREKGAFTGAMTRQIGRFEVADGSTLFLDEVGELSLDVQAKLLRVLESGEFERLGSPRTLKVNVRVVAATNRDLTEAIRQGRFREDLYYRLNVFPLRVPPLRDRAEDIPLLVWAFLEEFSSRMGKKITRVPRKTMETLQRHPWPGNVRELRNVIEHGAILTTGDTLRIPMLDETAPAGSPARTLADLEREHILRAITRAGGHIKGPKGAAAELGLNAGTLYSRMKKLGIPVRRQTDRNPA